jgi:hypothetical protein
MVLLLSTIAWADGSDGFDPRYVMDACDYTTVVETWEPDQATGILTKRVTYVAECDTPSVGEITLTETTEEWDGMSLVVTEVRVGVRTESGGIFTTETLIYGDELLTVLLGKEVHTYDYGISDPSIGWQAWEHYEWDGDSFEIVHYNTREVDGLGTQNPLITYIFYDTAFRADPVIPTEVPVLGSANAWMPPHMPKIPPKDEYGSIAYRMLLDTLRVTVNTHNESVRWLEAYPLNLSGLNPPGTYVAGVFMADRFDDVDPLTGEPFNGFFQRFVNWINDVDGNLHITHGWTEDRDLNVASNNWVQSSVKQFPDGSVEYLQHGHRVGEGSADHADTIVVLDNTWHIIRETYSDFQWLTGSDFVQETTVVDGDQNPLSFSVWTVTWD